MLKNKSPKSKSFSLPHITNGKMERRKSLFYHLKDKIEGVKCPPQVSMGELEDKLF